jgi:hypothetical protein
VRHALALFMLLGAVAAPVAAQRAAGPVLTVDAALSGSFDNNVGRDRAALDGYGGGGELLVRLASRPARPLLQLEYATSLRRTSALNPADGAGHRLNALAAVPFASWLRLDVIGRAGRGGVDEDLVSADELMLLGRLELQPRRRSRLRAYAARRWREPPAGAEPTLAAHAGIELRQRFGGGTTVLLDGRYEESHPPDTTRFWHRGSVAFSVGQRVASNTALEVEARHRQRLYPRRLIEVDDDVMHRRDDDWRIGLAIVYDNGRGAELRLELQHDERASTDPRRSYDAGRVSLTVRRRVLGFGGRTTPPRIDERAANQALQARATTAATAPTAMAFTSMAVGETGVCALADDGDVVCWPTLNAAAAGATPARLSGPWTALTAGPGRACALDTVGAAHCWHWLDGKAGTAVSAPVALRSDLRFTTLSVGSTHMCGLTGDGAAWCWGENGDGQLGTGTPLPAPTPARVATDVPFGAISAGSRHTCALGADGALFCWGANESGQAAAGTLRRTLAPQPVAGVRFVELAAGTRHNCARDAAGGVWCWGDNSSGQVGLPGGGQVRQPARIAAPAAFTTIGAGWTHSCALDAAGRAWCWGRNGQSDTGPAQGAPLSLPRPVASDRVFSALTVSMRTCALDRRQRVYCWGGGRRPGDDAPVLLSPPG